MQGGASGAIIVDGITKLQPAVTGPSAAPPDHSRPERRRQPRRRAGRSRHGTSRSTMCPSHIPRLHSRHHHDEAGPAEFWRVANASADTIFDLQVVMMELRSRFRSSPSTAFRPDRRTGSRRGKTVTQTDILIPPAGRAEFILDGPSAAVKNAVFQTLNIDTGPDGDNDPQRTLATIQATADAPPLPPVSPEAPADSAGPATVRGARASNSSGKTHALFLGGLVGSGIIRPARPISSSPSTARRQLCSTRAIRRRSPRSKDPWRNGRSRTGPAKTMNSIFTRFISVLGAINGVPGELRSAAIL